ncbi:uncharacterized protein V6R79_021888 [Siganus canaliculatus]
MDELQSRMNSEREETGSVGRSLRDKSLSGITRRRRKSRVKEEGVNWRGMKEEKSKRCKGGRGGKQWKRGGDVTLSVEGFATTTGFLCSFQRTPQRLLRGFIYAQSELRNGQLAAGTCEIVTLDRDSSQPQRTIARQTARCACKKGQIAGTTRARPACVDAGIVRKKQWCEMVPCLEDEGCNLLVNKSGWTCTQPGGRVKTTTVSSDSLLAPHPPPERWMLCVVPSTVFDWQMKRHEELSFPACSDGGAARREGGIADHFQQRRGFSCLPSLVKKDKTMTQNGENNLKTTALDDCATAHWNKNKTSLCFASMWVQNQTLFYSHISIFNSTCTEQLPCDQHKHRASQQVGSKPSRHVFKAPQRDELIRVVVVVVVV